MEEELPEPTPTSFAVFKMPTPEVRCSRMAASCAAEMLGRPMGFPLRVPRSLARAMPATACWCRNRSAPAPCSSCNTLIRSGRDRPRRFVRHVLSMDTTFPTNTLRTRAITNPPLWNAAYIAIITTEALTALAFAKGAYDLLRNLRAFQAARHYTIIGATLAFLLWFTGFMVIGGEYFSMWQSAIWNGQQAAFRFYATVLLVLIVVLQPDQDFPSSRRCRIPSISGVPDGYADRSPQVDDQ
jgi:predicted small integral membrane protein